MPYINKRERERYQKLIKDTVETLLEKYPGDNGKNFDEGDLNYVLSSIVWSLFDSNPSYRRANKLMGILGCVEKEFYRRKVAPYEDTKIKENGDI